MNQAQPISPTGLAIGAAVGLASGSLVDYALLLYLRHVSLPWPGPSLNQLPAIVWLLVVLLATTALALVYYGRES